MAVLAFYISKVNSRWRNNGGFGLFFLATLGCLLLDVITFGGGELRNYAVLCTFVGLFGIADALVKGGISGDLASMPSRFMQSYYAGMAASGTLASVLRIFTKAAIGGIRKGALLFMSIAVGIELICLCMYPFYFSNLPIVKYYRAKGTNQASFTTLLLLHRQIFPFGQGDKDGIPKGPDDLDPFSIPFCALLLLYCTIWSARLDVLAHISVRIQQWLPDCACDDFGSQRLQGTRAEGTREPIGAFSGFWFT
uniref:Uncharacterized protein n=1 Tax=Chenopodium quinoa TaxID=63459 RepID=A0A803LHQ4_CHEQI